MYFSPILEPYNPLSIGVLKTKIMTENNNPVNNVIKRNLMNILYELWYLCLEFKLLISGNNTFPYIPEKNPGIKIRGIAYPFKIPYSVVIVAVL